MNFDDLFIDSNLPNTLEKQELYFYLNQLKQGIKEARDIIIIHNIKLVLNRVLKRFINTNYELNELIAVGVIGLIKAVDAFDLSKKVDFIIYATKCIDNEILMFIRKNRKYNSCCSLQMLLENRCDKDGLKLEDIYYVDENNFIYDIEKKEILMIIKKQVESLDIRKKMIIKLYFGFYNDKLYTQEQIANEIGISRSHVSRLIKDALYEIKENLKKEHSLTIEI